MYCNTKWEQKILGETFKKHSRPNLTDRKTHRKSIDRWSEDEGQTCVHNGAARPKMGASGVVNDPVRLEMGQSRSPGLLTVSWPRDPWLWESLHLLLPLPFCGYSRSFHCCLNASWHLTGENSCFVVWDYCSFEVDMQVYHECEAFVGFCLNIVQYLVHVVFILESVYLFSNAVLSVTKVWNNRDDHFTFHVISIFSFFKMDMGIFFLSRNNRSLRW